MNLVFFAIFATVSEIVLFYLILAGTAFGVELVTFALLLGLYVSIGVFIRDVLQRIPAGSDKRRFWVSLILFTGPIGMIPYLFHRSALDV
jgi:hypothetical protein